MCLMPFFCKNDLNSLLTKLDPLSDTTIRVHTVDIHPLGMGVNDQQEHLSHERSRIVYVYSRPRAALAIPKGVIANREGSFGESDK